MIVLNEIEQRIADILVEAALNNKKVTFTEIMEKVGISRRKLGEYLSHIGNKCKELGFPAITVIVVYKSDGKVGKGYREFDPNYTPQSVENEQNKVFSQDSWYGLSQSVATWVNDIVLNDAAKMPQRTVVEGEIVDRHVSTYKRDTKLRNECLEEKGRVCSICGFDPVAKYGKGFENITEVHHLNPVSTGVRNTTIDNLIPVCPNCHRALHSKPGGLYTPKDLEDLINANKKCNFIDD